MQKINSAIITYFGNPARVDCDRNCGKAWGITSRPRVQFSDNPDDYAYLADGELGDAPADPGTYEGGEGKPLTPDDFPNKWCVRECERCSMTLIGKEKEDRMPLSFDRRAYNMWWLHEDKA